MLQSGGAMNHLAAGAVGQLLPRTADLKEPSTLERHVAALSAELQESCDALVDALLEAAPPGVRVARPDGGYFVWVVPPDLDASREAGSRATEADLSVRFGAGEDFYLGGEGAGPLRLCFARRSQEDLRQIGRKIGSWLKGRFVQE